MTLNQMAGAQQGPAPYTGKSAKKSKPAPKPSRMAMLAGAKCRKG